MAIYKVPQDVEADDKLLGPFSFRQFIYLLIVFVAGAAAYGLWGIMPVLSVIPVPFIVFFGALALPLRKDQPMEMYLAAILSFYLKPRLRKWEPDGIDSLIEIIAPREPERQLTKNLSQDEAHHRLGYLADISDTHGWSIRGTPQPHNTSMSADMYYEAQQVYDPMDTGGSLAQNLDSMMQQRTAARQQQVMAQMRQQVAPGSGAPGIVLPQPQVAPTQMPTLRPMPALQPIVPTPNLNPYPNAMNQAVVQPLPATPPAPAPIVQPVPTSQPTPVAQPPALAPQSTSATPPSPDIINLAHNSDLSVETIAREARRIEQKSQGLSEGGEVNISLR